MKYFCDNPDCRFSELVPEKHVKRGYLNYAAVDEATGEPRNKTVFSKELYVANGEPIRVCSECEGETA